MWLSVHAGHGKTGSSFLQSWLALNRDALRQSHGIRYPLQGPISGRRETEAGRGRFSMGNGFVLEEVLAADEPVRRLQGLAGSLPEEGQLLFSCERFVRSLTPRLPALARLATDAGFRGIRLLLFLRDPLEHAHSLHAEMVKAHGCSVSVATWLAVYDLHEAVEAFLIAAEALPGVTLTTFNYSLAPGRVLPQLRHWLRLPEAAVFSSPPARRVNRSLGRSELQALMVLNRVLGTQASVIGRRLVDDLPDLPVEPLVADPVSQQTFLTRLAPAVARINARLPVDQQLHLRSLPPDGPSPSPTIDLLPEQLELMASALLELGGRTPRPS